MSCPHIRSFAQLPPCLKEWGKFLYFHAVYPCRANLLQWLKHHARSQQRVRGWASHHPSALGTWQWQTTSEILKENCRDLTRQLLSVMFFSYIAHQEAPECMGLHKIGLQKKSLLLYCWYFYPYMCYQGHKKEFSIQLSLV